MATGPITQVTDVVVPEQFTPYIQQQTEVKSRIIQSGAAVVNPLLNNFLAGGGLTVNVPSFKPLDDDDANLSGDEVADIIALSQSAGSPALPGSFNDAIPKKIESATEIAVRLSRNQTWSDSDLAAALAGADPLAAIRSEVAGYWQRQLQKAFIATWNGVVKDNAANDSDDYTFDASGASYVAGVTTFSAEAALDAMVTMGDSQEDLGMVMVHSVVMNRMQKNNLIDFIPDARGEVNIPTFLGRRVVVDDGMPVTGGVYDSWFFGPGSTQLGIGSPRVGTETERLPRAGNGGGQSVLISRVEWAIHPVGHQYAGTAPNSGPGNGTGSNALNNAGSWDRVYAQRKQIKFARLLTRES